MKQWYLSLKWTMGTGCLQRWVVCHRWGYNEGNGYVAERVKWYFWFRGKLRGI